jgi:hypothetical protein
MSRSGGLGADFFRVVGSFEREGLLFWPGTRPLKGLGVGGEDIVWHLDAGL